MKHTLEDGANKGSPHRSGGLAALVAFGAFGAILLVLTGLILFPEKLDGPVAYLAISVIGAVAGLTLRVILVSAIARLRELA